jgi:glycosyltransferase 2 family protein
MPRSRQESRSVSTVLPVLAVLAIVSGLTQLDWGAFADEVANANWWLLALAFLMTQLPRVAQATVTLGASPVPIPLSASYKLQLASSYINVALPSAAARAALSIRFFQRYGVPPATAVASGVLDSVAGFVVQFALLVVIVVFSPVSLDLNVSAPSGDAGRIAALVVAIVLIALIVVALVPRCRAFLAKWIGEAKQGVATVAANLRSGSKALQLFGGQLATEVLFAVAIGVFTQAFGTRVGLLELLLVNIGVGLLAGLMPVPGGIGVAESGLIVGLRAVGVPETEAFAVAIGYRLSSFYLPPTWGWFALKSLQRRGQV